MAVQRELSNADTQPEDIRTQTTEIFAPNRNRREGHNLCIIRAQHSNVLLRALTSNKVNNVDHAKLHYTPHPHQ